MSRARQILAALMLGLLALTALGCSKPAASKPKTTIRVAAFQQDQLMKLLIEDYLSKHPDIQIERVPLSEGGTNDRAKAITDGKADVFAGFGAADLAQLGLLQPFDAFVQKDSFDLAPLGRLADLQNNGRLYELPYQLSPFVLMYNRDLIEQAGVTIPTEPMTWDALRDLARRLTHHEGDNQIWGFDNPLTAYSLETYIRSNAAVADWWNDAETVGKGFQFFSDLIRQDQSSPPAPPLDQYGRPQTAPDTGFGAGKAALTISQLYSLGSLGSDQLHVGATFLPVPAGRAPIGLARPATISLSATAENMDAAWAFIRYVTGPDAAVIIAQHGVLPAYRKPEIADAWVQSYPGTPAELKQLATMELKLVRDDDPTIPNRANDHIAGLGYDVFAGKRTWQDALALYQKSVPTARK